MGKIIDSLIQEYLVRSFHINAGKQLSLPSLLNFLQETAGLHANALHFGMGDLQRKNHTWVLSRMLLEMDRWPVLGETIAIETWPRGIDRLYATRDYLVLDSKQSPIGRASSYWLIVDRTSRRPQSPDHMKQHVVSQERQAIPRQLGKIKAPANIFLQEVRKAYHSDTDMNGHVNNVRYTEWILDSIPEEVHNKSTLRSWEINYLAEVMPGEEVVIQRGPLENKTMMASIVLKDSKKEACRSEIHFL